MNYLTAGANIKINFLSQLKL